MGWYAAEAEQQGFSTVHVAIDSKTDFFAMTWFRKHAAHSGRSSPGPPDLLNSVITGTVDPTKETSRRLRIRKWKEDSTGASRWVEVPTDLESAKEIDNANTRLKGLHQILLREKSCLDADPITLEDHVRKMHAEGQHKWLSMLPGLILDASDGKHNLQSDISSVWFAASVEPSVVAHTPALNTSPSAGTGGTMAEREADAVFTYFFPSGRSS